ncbi:MAG: cell wall-binding repeat-containing protein [Actinobacteria bacterium]|nr:cell wall-binding repeat-containing protein [Actinomycetota bacterium]
MSRIAMGILAVVALALPLTPSTSVAASPEDPRTDRVGGATRVGTAAELAQATFGSSERVLMARADDFPDALAAASLAGDGGHPILLAHHAAVPERSYEALDALEAAAVTLLGGTAALSDDVADELRQAGYEVDRVAGADRYATAAEIARSLEGEIGTVEGQRTAFIASGERFPDALTAGPAAFAGPFPILLTRREEVPAATVEALDELGIERAVLVGGRLAVDVDVARRIEAQGITTVRVAGRDRTDTAARVATWSVRHAGIEERAVVLARGDEFPDALAAAPFAGESRAPMVLTRRPDELTYDLLQWVVDRSETIAAVHALGLQQAVTDRVLRRTAEAAQPPSHDVRYAVDVADDHGPVHADPRYFAEHVDWTLTDQRGWSLDNDVRWTRVPRDDDTADLTVLLSSPQDVEAAAPGCDASYSCRVGDEVYINDQRWREGPQEDAWSRRPIEDYRHYVVLHELGHWLELDHYECRQYAGAGKPAPVMDQQTIDTGVCTTNVWPLEFELDQARRNIETGDAQGSGNVQAE